LVGRALAKTWGIFGSKIIFLSLVLGSMEIDGMFGFRGMVEVVYKMGEYAVRILFISSSKFHLVNKSLSASQYFLSIFFSLQTFT